MPRPRCSLTCVAQLTQGSSPSTPKIKYVFNKQSKGKKKQSWNPPISHWWEIELHWKITLPWELGAGPTSTALGQNPLLKTGQSLLYQTRGCWH